MRFPLFPVFLTATLFFAFACSRVPVTNRKQMNMIPEKELVSLSLNEYQGFLKKNPPLPTSDTRVAMVKRAGTRIQASVVSYLNKNKLGKRVQGYQWEFNLVDDKTVNAWCMPGGKVMVYTGLLDVTQNEDALAIVMGHEIAHAVARHGNERMSQMLMAQAGGIALSVALQNQSTQTRGMFETAYGLGASVGVILPFSRLHETEADKLGLIFAAMAGYNPKEAPKFWQRMAAKGNGKTPEFLSTHPSDQKRIQDLNEFMPEAMKYYKPRI
jgi:predicted Zn-dependent protease